ncbi:muts domain V-domain-containing protein [Zopfochytrium polystomum]|nr:muts domain V-domain-containing protein [Zopfochytrium polystomum]
MKSQEDFAIPGLDFQFCTAKTVFFKSEEMYEMDNTVGDIHSAIVDREIEIIQHLQDTVLTMAPTLDAVARLCAETDCLLAFAQAAFTYNLKRPTTSDSTGLEIVNGRHPLQELCVNIFVPNSIRFGTSDHGDQQARVFLLTGPNASGKSVFIRQVGLIVFMAHLGCFVPADRAVVGITDRILTRIQTVESASKVQSSFMLDANQMAHALRSATERSLILVDEFGRGTSALDGIGLFCGAVEYLLSKGPAAPKAILSTHFHEVFNHRLITEQPSLRTISMEFLTARGSGASSGQDNPHDDTPVTFLYR